MLYYVPNNAKSISVELLELNLKKKLEETGKTKWSGKKQDEPEKLKEKKQPKIVEKMDDTEQNKKKQEETERNSKKQEETGRNKMKQEETWRNMKIHKETGRNR